MYRGWRLTNRTFVLPLIKIISLNHHFQIGSSVIDLKYENIQRKSLDIRTNGDESILWTVPTSIFSYGDGDNQSGHSKLLKLSYSGWHPAKTCH